MDETLYLWEVITLSGGIELYLHLIQAKTKGLELRVHLHDSDHKTSHHIDIAQYLTHLEYGGHWEVKDHRNEVEADIFKKRNLLGKPYFGATCEVPVEDEYECCY